MRLNEQTTSLFNIEMVGWSQTKMANHPVLKLYTRQPKVPGQEQDIQLANAFVRAATLLKSLLKPVILQNGFNRSDNWSFWQKSFPAICISEDREKDFNKTHYHTPTDAFDTLNFSYIEEVAKVTTEMLAEISRNNLMKPSEHGSKGNAVTIPPADGSTF
jgi:Zn-dependent M28 family amino/carboxypeptidase